MKEAKQNIVIRTFNGCPVATEDDDNNKENEAPAVFRHSQSLPEPSDLCNSMWRHSLPKRQAGYLRISRDHQAQSER